MSVTGFVNNNKKFVAAVALGCVAAWTIAAWAARQAHAGAPDCGLPGEFAPAEVELPKTASSLRAGGKVKIVVIGGGSTAGAAAGGGVWAYPERFAVALRALFPKSEITIANRGVVRQTAQEMANRFDRDVLGEKPLLVVWETGIADSVRGVEVDEFRETIDLGVQKLHASGAEVVLMDTQYMRRANVVIASERYDLTLREIADVRAVPLFRRNELMRYWAEHGVFNYDETNEKERRATIVRVYDCVGRALADFVVRAFPPPAAGK
jgi:hypothetical protein